MFRRLVVIGSVLCSYSAFGLNDLTAETNEINESSVEVSEVSSDYINRQAYIQNPYIGMPSGGGTQNIAESQYVGMTAAEKLFTTGSWNVFGAASYVSQNGANNYGYGANIFAQTGQLAGFSVGGLMTVMNPVFSGQINPSNIADQAQGLSIYRQITPQELFLEYQYSNVVQADAGWIGISNSPWMTYYQNNALNMVTYQGAIVNVNPGGGWSLSAFAINGAQLLGENGFSQETMYNSDFDYGTGTTDIGNRGTPSTFAMGANWSSSGGMLDARLWGYQFTDYANMAYADTTIKLPVNDDLGFTLGFQGAMQGANGSGNILNDSGYGSSVDSNMLGAQLGFNYSILGLQLGYNNIWGPSDAYQSGGLISPYTYQYATDPLFTTGWIQGMVERSAGQAYKVAPSLSILDNNLVITPSYQYYATTIIPASSEYDLQISYNIPEIKGLTVFGGYGYLTNVNDDGDNVYQAQLMLSYIY